MPVRKPIHQVYTQDMMLYHYEDGDDDVPIRVSFVCMLYHVAMAKKVYLQFFDC